MATLYKTFVALIALIALLIGLSWYSGKGMATPAEQDISPKKYYRVEFWHPSSFSFQSWNKDFPAFVRIYDNRKNKLLYESKIVDINGNGTVSWPTQKDKDISIGVENISFSAEPESE